MVVPLSHLKVKRASMDYEHHYLVTNICTTMSGTVVVTIVQYTSSELILTGNDTGVGKVVIETYEIGENIRNDLFDFDSGLFLIHSKSFYPKNSVDFDEAYKRIGKRLGEAEYHLNWNNCEHLVNYILTGKSASEQFRRARRWTDLCNSLIANIKEIGITTALIVSALGAIAGSLVRRAYVRVILAALISFETNIGLLVVDTCPNIIGRNIIHEAKLRISEGTNLPNASAIPDLDNIIKNTNNKLNNTYVCQVAEYFAWHALWKVCISSLATSFGIETVIIVCFVYFNLIPLRKIFLKNKEFCRILFLRLLSGYMSTVMAVALGALGQLFLTRPARAYFLIAFGSGLFLRYVLTIFAGFLFDSLSCCFCWNCCPTCENIEARKSRSLGFTLVLVIIILSIMAITLGFLLN